MKIAVQTEDFDVALEMQHLRQARTDVGALVSFVGLVRDLNEGDAVAQLSLEHYPGMTEKALQAIAHEAAERWDIFDATVIHRVGTLQATDQIVLVVVASRHRAEAFKACEFIMDYLKTQAPFWKKESSASGARWLDAKDSDDEARQRWLK